MKSDPNTPVIFCMFPKGSQPFACCARGLSAMLAYTCRDKEQRCFWHVSRKEAVYHRLSSGG